MKLVCRACAIPFISSPFPYHFVRLVGVTLAVGEENHPSSMPQVNVFEQSLQAGERLDQGYPPAILEALLDAQISLSAVLKQVGKQQFWRHFIHPVGVPKEGGSSITNLNLCAGSEQLFCDLINREGKPVSWFVSVVHILPKLSHSQSSALQLHIWYSKASQLKRSTNQSQFAQTFTS